jgi:hypothetical protein
MRILKWAWMMVLAFSVTVGYAQESSVPNLDKIGTIKKVYGDVKLVRQSVEARPVAGDPVLRGDKLITGVYSNVSVVMRDRTTLMLGSKSAVDLTKFDFDSTTPSISLKLLRCVSPV